MSLQKTINEMFQVWESILTLIKFLCPRWFNQDPMKNFFCRIRQQGGNCDTPTAIEFTRVFWKLFYDNYLTSSNANCTPDLDASDLDAMLVKCKDAKETTELVANVDGTAPFQIEVYYQLTSYLLKKCLQKHNYQTCSKVH